MMDIDWIAIAKDAEPAIGDDVVVWVYSAHSKEVIMARQDKHWYCGSARNYWAEHGGDDGQMITGITHYRPIVKPDPPQEA